MRLSFDDALSASRVTAANLFGSSRKSTTRDLTDLSTVLPGEVV